MTSIWAILFLAVAGGWAGALVLGMLAMRLLRHDIFVLAPLVDLFGTWAGAIGIGLLAVGRVGYSWQWALAVFVCALGVTAGLYDRAVLMPSLQAARKRVEAEPQEPKWASEWRFLWRMAGWSRAVTLLSILAAIACVALIPW